MKILAVLIMLFGSLISVFAQKNISGVALGYAQTSCTQIKTLHDLNAEYYRVISGTDFRLTLGGSCSFNPKIGNFFAVSYFTLGYQLPLYAHANLFSSIGSSLNVNAYYEDDESNPKNKPFGFPIGTMVSFGLRHDVTRNLRLAVSYFNTTSHAGTLNGIRISSEYEF